MKEIDIDDLNELDFDLIIDIREPYEFEQYAIPSIKNIPMLELVNNAETHLDKNKTYYLLCRSGVRSADSCEFLTEQGFDVVNIKRGIINYDFSSNE